MKKRLLGILVACMLSFSLCACGDPATVPTAQTGESTEQQNTTEETATQPTEETETVEEPQTTEEVATEETATQPTEETETAELTEEPEPEPQYTYTDMSATMYAKQSVNVRTLPSTDGERVGSLSTNQEITITGQCNETGWYRFEYNGSTAYVSNKYLSDTKVEVSAPSASAETSAPSDNDGGNSGGSTASASGIDQYPVCQWIDLGDAFAYINTSLAKPDNGYDEFWATQAAILQERYPDRYVGWGQGYFLNDRGWSVWFVYANPSQGGTSFLRSIGL